jgi:methylaspartate mutase epsilon subunit
MSDSKFQSFIHRIRSSGALAVQPRMGWGSPSRMRRALECVKSKSQRCVGTLTLDSYTRVGDYRTPTECLSRGDNLNGYPLLSHSVETTKALLDGLLDDNFPIQVRHGTPEPQSIFKRTIEVGLDASEGGPVSYCLPYGRTPLAVSINAWREACSIFANGTECGHIESFGGCLMGQLCPPAMLLTISLIECLFFKQYGIRSVSLSYAQGPSYAQDRAALALLQRLAGLHLGNTDWHVVVYTYMGLFPESRAGATRLIEDSADLAAESGCQRLIVKTTAERRQIPPLRDNLAALGIALARSERPKLKLQSELTTEDRALQDELSEEVQRLLEAVLNLSPNLSKALLMAFRRGLLDIPYCLHPDNLGKARAAIDKSGMLRWEHVGDLPIKGRRLEPRERLSSDLLLAQLSHVARSYDHSPSISGSANLES